LYGAGLSANIRAAYGFLAHNYDPNPGDEIFFVGFSRGAYTARSIAGLVTKLGLLTKRGMDWFPQVYEEFYSDPTSKPDFQFSKGLLQTIGDQVTVKAKDAIKIVAVWETVAFHSEGMVGEKIEFHNAELSSRIGYAYHALALDERRIPYKPILMQWPQGYQVKSDGTGLQIMKQVWFSGVHSDVGGGHYDPACSDITIAWMLAQCNKDKKLGFTDEYDSPQDPDDYYLLPDRTEPNPNTKWTRLAHAPAPDPHESILDKGLDAAEVLVSEARKAFPLDRTYERIHRSIRFRDFTAWPCGMLDGEVQGNSWELKAASARGSVLVEAEADTVADAIEEHYIDRIRATPGCKGGPSG